MGRERIQKVIEALRRGFAHALNHEDGIGYWDDLIDLMREESRQRKDRRVNEDLSFKAAGAGQQEIEVYEFERRNPIGDWITPWLPTDRHLSYRWLDVQGYRHPHLCKQTE